VGFFSAAGEGSGPATFEGDSADAGDQTIMLHQVTIAISNWIHAPKTLEVLGLAATTPTGFAEIIGDNFPVLPAQGVLTIEILRRKENFACVRIFYCGPWRTTGHVDVTAIWGERTGN
jgi:hypothetical protein